jgi:beta-phosphoglucomutase-like phosphatase (HAD superfamily)
MYNLAIDKLGLQPHECLIVEDNDHGLKAAIASGAHVLKVENPDDVHYYNIKRRITELQNA